MNTFQIPKMLRSFDNGAFVIATQEITSAPINDMYGVLLDALNYTSRGQYLLFKNCIKFDINPKSILIENPGFTRGSAF